MLYYDQYFIMKIVNDPKYREEYDLSSLKGILLGGNLAGTEFKNKLLKIAPLSIVSTTDSI